MDIKSKILEEAEANGVNVINLADAMEKCPTLSEVIKCSENKLVWHEVDVVEGGHFDNLVNRIAENFNVPTYMVTGESRYGNKLTTEELEVLNKYLNGRDDKLNSAHDFFATDNSKDGQDCTLTYRESKDLK